MGFAATLLYLATLLLRPQELYPVFAQYRIMDVLGAIAAASTLLSLLIERRPRPVWQQLATAALFLIWSALSVAIAVRWLGGAAERLFDLLVQIYVLFILALNVSSRRRLAACVALICICLLVLLGQSASAYYSDVEQSPFFLKVIARSGVADDLDAQEAPELKAGDAEAGNVVYVRRARALGFLHDPNDFAQAMVAIIPLLFLAWRPYARTRNLLLVLVPAGLFVWGILLTRSRGGLLALVLLLPLARLLRMRPRTRHVATIALAVAAVPGFIVLFRYALSDESAMGRIEAWSAGLQMLKASPVWGVGSGFFMDHHVRVAHSSLVQCFAETGLVGYFLWLAFVVLSLDLMSRLAETSTDEGWIHWARCVQLSLLGFLVGALFLSRTTSPLLFLITGISAAVASAARLDGQTADLGRAWPVRVLGIEFASVLAVWLIAIAAW